MRFPWKWRIADVFQHWRQKIVSRFQKEFEDRLLALPFDVFAIGVVALLYCGLESYLKGTGYSLLVGSILVVFMTAWLFAFGCAILVASPLAMYVKRVCGFDTSLTSDHVIQLKEYCKEVFQTCQQNVGSDIVAYEMLHQMTIFSGKIERYARARGELGGKRIVQSVDDHIRALQKFDTNGLPYSTEGIPEPETTLQFVIDNPLTPPQVVEEARRLLDKRQRTSGSSGAPPQ